MATTIGAGFACMGTGASSIAVTSSVGTGISFTGALSSFAGAESSLAVAAKSVSCRSCELRILDRRRIFADLFAAAAFFFAVGVVNDVKRSAAGGGLLGADGGICFVAAVLVSGFFIHVGFGVVGGGGSFVDFDCFWWLIGSNRQQLTLIV